MDHKQRAELERRLALIEDRTGPDGPLAPLPLRDFLAAVVGLALVSLLLVWWAL